MLRQLLPNVLMRSVASYRERSNRISLTKVIGLSLTMVLLVGFSKPQLTSNESDRIYGVGMGMEPMVSSAIAGPNILGPLSANLTEEAHASLSPLAMVKRAGQFLKLKVFTPKESLPLGPVLVQDNVKTQTALQRTQQPFLGPNGESKTDRLSKRFRVFSFTNESPKQSLLGPIEARLWLAESNYSPDKARAELFSQHQAHFLSVGFPDIRTYSERAKVFDYRTVDPMTWYQLIAWRESDDTTALQEPIAHVRCMGLSPQAVAKRADRYETLIHELAEEHDVSANLIKAVITEESCFNKNALSPVGALGLMQLMPKTASWLNVKDPKNPEQNLRAGVRYLAKLREEFDTLELALAAYNAGPGNVRRYNGIPPFKETIGYVQKVQANYRRYAAATRLAGR